jgi:hypothetical protein
MKKKTEKTTRTTTKNKERKKETKKPPHCKSLTYIFLINHVRDFRYLF